MTREDVELVKRLIASLPAGQDFKVMIDDEAIWGALRGVVDPEAETRFVDAEGGALGDMRVPLRGIEGLRAGWREWLEPWEQFRIHYEENLDAGDGRVLSLVELHGRVRGGIEISQPGASITQIRDGRIVAMHFYMDQQQAGRDAGLG
jgi:ketosteroid isomerase-like protein